MENLKWKSLFIFLLAVVVLTGCLPKKEGSTKTDVSTEKETKQEESLKEKAEPKGEGLTGTIKDLISLGKSLKCTWKEDDFSSTGYIKGKKYYGEVSRKDEEGNQMTGNVIIKDECMWSWDKDKVEGIKLCFEPSEMEGGDDSGKSIWDMESSVTGTEYKCVPAVIQDSKFEPPTDVNFMDMEEMMKNFTE